jgi:hypothetical protein
MPMATTASPMMNGAMFAPGAMLRASVMASTRITSMAVPMIWSRSAPSWEMFGMSALALLG